VRRVNLPSPKIDVRERKPDEVYALLTPIYKLMNVNFWSACIVEGVFKSKRVSVLIFAGNATDNPTT